MNPIPGTPAFYWLAIYKAFSAFAAVYILSLCNANQTTETPFISGKVLAHMTSFALGLRALDSLVDPFFQKLNPLRMPALSDDDRKIIASETTMPDSARQAPPSSVSPTT